MGRQASFVDFGDAVAEVATVLKEFVGLHVFRRQHRFLVIVWGEHGGDGGEVVLAEDDGFGDGLSGHLVIFIAWALRWKVSLFGDVWAESQLGDTQPVGLEGGVHDFGGGHEVCVVLIGVDVRLVIDGGGRDM